MEETPKISCYDILLEINGRTLILPSDNDRIVFVNFEKNRWDDGTPATVDDMIRAMRILMQDAVRPIAERDRKYSVGFVDGVGEEGYGKGILCTEDGEPVIRVEDGKIRSAATECVCDTSYPQGKGVRTEPSYGWFKARLDGPSAFDHLKWKRRLKQDRYQCRVCKRIWILGKPDPLGRYLWLKEETLTRGDHS